MGVALFDRRIGDRLYAGVQTGAEQGVISLSGNMAAACAEFYNENLEYIGDYQQLPAITNERIKIEDLKSSLLRSEFNKYEALKNQFVKFNNVRVLNGYSSAVQVCTFSSITKAELPPKTTFRFTLKSAELKSFFSPGGVGNPKGNFLIPGSIYFIPGYPDKSTLTFEPIYVQCGSGYSWTSSKQVRKINERIEKGEFAGMNSAEIELVGVKLTDYKVGLCTIDAINIRKLN